MILLDDDIDSQSIAYSPSMKVIYFWGKNTVSNAAQKNWIGQEKNKERKKILAKVSDIKDYREINTAQNTYRVTSHICYSANGMMLESRNTPWADWIPIPPDSIIEGLRDTVIHTMDNHPELVVYR